jgi:RNA polymerase sigma-70 factor (ECF subfamily)
MADDISTNELNIRADARLVTRFQAGDTQAFDDLVSIHTDRIFAVAYEMLRQREDAEEATQEVLVNLYRQVSGPNPPRLLRAWLYRVCVNTCINWQRARKRRPMTLELSEEIPATRTTDPAAVAADSAFHDYVEDVVAGFPAQQRLAFTLCHFGGLSVREIGEVLRCSPTTVRVHLSRATLRLRAIVSGEMTEDECL